MRNDAFLVFSDTKDLGLRESLYQTQPNPPPFLTPGESGMSSTIGIEKRRLVFGRNRFSLIFDRYSDRGLGSLKPKNNFGISGAVFNRVTGQVF